MNEVYTDDQGNTYTILQLCKKVLKEIDNINGLVLYKHDIKMRISGIDYSVSIINNVSSAYIQMADLVDQLEGHILSGKDSLQLEYRIFVYGVYGSTFKTLMCSTMTYGGSLSPAVTNSIIVPPVTVEDSVTIYE